MEKWWNSWINYWTGGSKSHAPTSQAQPPLPPQAIALKGNIWLMDPASHVVTRMVAVRTHDKQGYTLVATNEHAFIPTSHTHKDAYGNFILDAMPAGGTMVNGIPVFQRRNGHRVAAIDAGHGVNWSGYYDSGSKSAGHAGAGNPVDEATINLHLAKDTALAFARRGWDTIVTRSSNTRPRVTDGGFDFRISAANQADAYVSLHTDQRLGDVHDKDPQKRATARELHSLQSKVESIKSGHGDLSALNAHEKDLLRVIAGKGGVRVYIDDRLADNDRSLQFGQFINDSHYRGDIIHDGYVRRPSYKMINGEKIRGPLSVLLEPGAIDIAADEMNMRSTAFRQKFATELAMKVEYFYSKCLPALNTGQAAPAPCVSTYHAPAAVKTRASQHTEPAEKLQAKPVQEGKHSSQHQPAEKHPSTSEKSNHVEKHSVEPKKPNHPEQHLSQPAKKVHPAEKIPKKPSLPEDLPCLKGRSKLAHENTTHGCLHPSTTPVGKTPHVRIKS